MLSWQLSQECKKRGSSYDNELRPQKGHFMHRIIRITLMASVFTLLCTVGLGAEEAAGAVGDNVEGGNVSFLSRVIGAGPVEWVLILLSFIGFSLGIHRLLTIKADMLIPDGLADDMHNIFADGITEDAVEEATNIVAEDDSMLGQVLYAALDKKDFGYEAMAESAESVGAAEHNKYMGQIAVLSLLASIGPMLGLLGTVWGMIGAFFKMANSGGQVDAALLADDIGGAMITTATGLIIAIPMLVIFFFLRARVNKFVLEAGVLTGEVLDYFRQR